MTLEQQRAQDAWRCCENYKKEAVNLAKALPALIMNSGLMQVMAFCHAKGEHYETVAAGLRRWLIERFPNNFQGGKDLKFEQFMNSLMQAPPAEFQAITVEALAWLKWLRHMASARHAAAPQQNADKATMKNM